MRPILPSCLLIATTIAHAIPAKKMWRTYIQRDGSTTRVFMVGDERLHYFLTNDQVLLVQRDNNLFCTKIEKDRLVSSNTLTHETSLRTAVEKKNIRTVQEIEPPREKAPTRLYQLNKLPAMRKNRYAGKKKDLIILANFSNKTSRDEDPQRVFDDIANKSGYKGYGGVGSVHDYFYDQSSGRSDLSFDVMGPIQLKHTLAYYDGDKDGQIDARVSGMIVGACQAVNEKADFRDYDQGSDGVVDQIAVVYVDYGQTTPVKSEIVWLHRFNIKSRSLVPDRVRINTYACSNKLYEYYTGADIGHVHGTLMGIDVICHEFPHRLRASDSYDIGESKSYGIGDWDTIANGSYNSPLGIGWVPPVHTSYEKNFADWLDHTVLGHEPQHVTDMKPLLEGGEVYAIYNPQNHDEYYSSENRGCSRWDSYPPKSGLLILRVDYDMKLWAYNMVNNIEQEQYNAYQRLTIAPADAGYGNADRDIYPLGEHDSLTANSTLALTSYNANWNNNYVLYNKVLNVRKDASGPISFNYLPDPYFNMAEMESVFNGDATTTAASIYNIQGQRMSIIRLNGLPHSLYLLNLSDNATRKVAVE